jgi:PKD repeat protein
MLRHPLLTGSTTAPRTPPTPLSNLAKAFAFITLVCATTAAWTADVGLEWDPVNDDRVALYEVHWGTETGVYTEQISSTTTSATLNGLQDGAIYYIAARACAEGSTLCSDFSSELSVTIANAAPTAQFTLSDATGTAPLNVSFTNSSRGTIDIYAWDFGDGTTSQEASPTHVYSEPGTYVATLTVTGPGGSDSATSANAIEVTHPAPIASFTESRTSGTAPLTVSFTSTTAGAVDVCTWDFDSGMTATGCQAVQTFSTIGTFSVMLTVAGPGGIDSVTKSDLIVTNGPPPVANFTSDTTAGEAALSVSFSSLSTGDISAYHWDFGDGTTSAEVNPAHSYTTPGTYDVSLTVSGPSGGDTATRLEYIQVSDVTLPIEVAEIVVDERWQRVDFASTFNDPIVIAKPMSANGSDPATIRIDDIDPASFSIRVQEWDYDDGVHELETVTYIAIERGRHQLSNGTWLEADSMSVVGSRELQTQGFTGSFDTIPIVIAAVVSDNDSNAVTTRLGAISPDTFGLTLQEQKSSKHSHAAERVDYIAWEPSIGQVNGMAFEVAQGMDQVTHVATTFVFNGEYQVPPAMLADIQTMNEADTAVLRIEYKDASSMSLWVEEELSRNSQVKHAAETMGYISIETSDAKPL